MTTNSNHLYSRLRHFFVREDADYEYYTENYQARTTGQKAFCFFMYFFPGILAFVFINQKSVFDWILNHTGLTGSQYQYIGFIFVTFGIHSALPFLILRFVDKLTLRQSLAFLSLDKLDWKGVLVIAPIFFDGIRTHQLSIVHFHRPPVAAFDRHHSCLGHSGA